MPTSLRHDPPAPVKILHLIEPGSPGGGPCTLALLAGLRACRPDFAGDVLAIGGADDVAFARRCGIEVTGAIAPPVRWPALVMRGARRSIRNLEVESGRYDVIHAWTLGGAALAALAAPGRRRVATVSVGPERSLAMHLVGRLLGRRPGPILATTRAVERGCASAGIPRRLLSVVPPAVDRGETQRVDRAALRRRWGCDDRAFLVGMLSDPPQWSDARSATSIVMRTAGARDRTRVLLHGQASRRVAGSWWAEQIVGENVTIVEDDMAEPWKVVAGLDAVLHLHPAQPAPGEHHHERVPGALPVMWAMAAGCPVIAEPAGGADDLVRAAGCGWVIDRGEPNAAADAINRLDADRAMALELGRRAREYASEHLTPRVYAERMAEEYARVGAPVTRSCGSR